MVVIIHNTTGIKNNYAGKDIEPDGYYTIPTYDLDIWAEDEEIQQAVQDGYLVVNDGNDNLSPELGQLLLERKLKKHHDFILFFPAMSLDAPSVIELGDCVLGYKFDIGDKLYAYTRLDNIVGDQLWLDIHMAIDNADSDKWIAWKISAFSSTGSDGKIVTSTDFTATTDPILVPTTPYAFFRTFATLPTSLLDNGEKYLFISGERVTPIGKDSPNNSPMILRVCKIFYERVDTQG